VDIASFFSLALRTAPSIQMIARRDFEEAVIILPATYENVQLRTLVEDPAIIISLPMNLPGSRYK
jgi:hypothetical protein